MPVAALTSITIAAKSTTKTNWSSTAPDRVQINYGSSITKTQLALPPTVKLSHCAPPVCHPQQSPQTLSLSIMRRSARLHSPHCSRQSMQATSQVFQALRPKHCAYTHLSASLRSKVTKITYARTFVPQNPSHPRLRNPSRPRLRIPSRQPKHHQIPNHRTTTTIRRISSPHPTYRTPRRTTATSPSSR